MRMSSTKPYETTQKHAYENVAFIQLKCQNPLGQKQTVSVSKNKSAEVTLYKTKMAAPMDVNKHSFLEKRS